MVVTITSNSVSISKVASFIEPLQIKTVVSKEAFYDALYDLKQGYQPQLGFLCYDCNWYKRILFVGESYYDLSCVELPDGNLFVTPAYRLMDRCSKCKKALNAYKRVKRWAKEIEEKVEYYNYTPFAMTITLGSDVDKTQEPKILRNLLMKKMNRLRDRSDIWNKCIHGGIQAFEVTHKDGLYHPHLHLICLVPNEMVTKHKLRKELFVELKQQIHQYVNNEYFFLEHCYTKKYGEKVYDLSQDSIKSAVFYAIEYASKDLMKKTAEEAKPMRSVSKFGIMRKTDDMRAKQRRRRNEIARLESLCSLGGLSYPPCGDPQPKDNDDSYIGDFCQ